MTAPKQVGSEPDLSRRDLGFGSVLARATATRLLNRDGTFATRREGLRIVDSVALYHYLLTSTWPRFLGLVALGYVVLNLGFAFAFTALGPEAFAGVVPNGGLSFFWQIFFFSVHTIATIGYGNISPASLSANVLVMVESLVSLIGVALIAGMVFARVSRPIAGLVFSERAVIAPYHGGAALMFRVANARRHELIQLRAIVTLAYRGADGNRQFRQLHLERHDVVFLPTSWTVVHPIDDASPLRGMDAVALQTALPEVFILLTATEEDFSQTVHARRSYAGDEILYGARFVPVLKSEGGVVTSVDVSRLSDVEPAELPMPARAT
jgi:inward rectifier potassium channel